jgi:hypothetical protein
MPSGARNWSGGCVASWLVPYRNPSPTLAGVPVVEPRFTVNDSAAAAFSARPSSGTPTASATATAMATRPALDLSLMETPLVLRGSRDDGWNVSGHTTEWLWLA